MAHKKPYTDNFADLVARLNKMSNITPEQERKSLLESASAEPRLLDEKDVSLADIAKLAGIKEYIEPVKVSQKAQKMVENITQPQSDITKVIKEADADNSISKKSAAIKGIQNAVAGQADVLLVPSVETGNGLVKMMIYFMGACAAGVVVGGKVPVVITSRSDEAQARLASIAAAVVALD